MNSPRMFVIVLLLLTACGGGAGADSAAVRTVDVVMKDVAFEPSSLSVATGETVRFRFINTGEAIHDAFLGDPAAQDEHEEAMSGGHGGHGGSADAALSLAPGESGELVHTFRADETVMIGCHQPGHYIAGMVLNIIIGV